VVAAVRADAQIGDHLLLPVVRAADGARVAGAHGLGLGLLELGLPHPADIDADSLRHGLDGWSRGNRGAIDTGVTETVGHPVALPVPAAQDEGGVVAPEPERVGQRDLDISLATDVGDVVEVAAGVGVGLVDRRRQEPVAHRQRGQDRLQGAGGAQQVAGLALGRRDRHGPRPVLAQRQLERPRLGRVTDRGRRRMGVDVAIIDKEMLTTGDLSRFDTIVVGVRASEARPDFVANQARLRAYMERGGTLIVQYQQTDYVERNLPPYPVKSPGNSRVTDETAAVRILAPMHPAFNYPNRITSADFDGWVQERNLYSFGTFDQRYTPLLESADPGEAPQRGGEVIADVGKGKYVYTSYAWFRQLRAGVPGAYRQFANLISLPKAP